MAIFTQQPPRRRRGAMLVLIAITIILLLIAVAFSVDVAFMQLTRTELRTSTDAAARAAIEALSREQNVAAARLAARTAAAANPVANDPLLLDDADIVFGRSSEGMGGVFDWIPGQQPFNSVRITGRRTADSPSGSVGLLFSGVLGQTTFVPTQVARAVNLDRDICLVIDRSGSMNQDVIGTGSPGGNWCNGPHPTLSRWGALRRSITIFLATLNTTDLDELVGMATYSSDGNLCGVPIPASRVDSELASNYSLIEAAMINYSATTAPSTPPLNNNRVRGRTNIAAGLAEGVGIVTNPATRRPFAEQTLIVLTDGIANEPGNSEASGAAAVVQAARDAKAANPLLIIHTITFSDSANQVTMQDVARVGGGDHFHAPTAARLEEIFREIALTLPVIMTE